MYFVLPLLKYPFEYQLSLYIMQGIHCRTRLKTQCEDLRVRYALSTFYVLFGQNQQRLSSLSNRVKLVHVQGYLKKPNKN